MYIVYDIRLRLRGFLFLLVLFCLCIDVQLLQHHLLEKPSLLHWITFAPWPKINWPYSCWCISGLFILLHWSMSIPLKMPCSFDYCSFTVILKIRQCDCSKFIFLFPNYFSYSSSFVFLINFRISLSVSAKNNLAGILIIIALNL